ncbi:MAG: hypothetical protein WBQ44_20770, partial [Rhodococcus sp. (in: high G+C Gram-positive bacteria)]
VSGHDLKRSLDQISTPLLYRYACHVISQLRTPTGAMTYSHPSLSHMTYISNERAQTDSLT